MSDPDEPRADPTAHQTDAFVAVPGTAGTVLVRTSRTSKTITTAVLLDDRRCVLVDPAIDAADVAAIADWVERGRHEVVFGWSTHPHWDHVLWSERLGADVPRFGTPANAEVCAADLEKVRRSIGAASPGHDLATCGLVTPVDQAGHLWPAGWQVVAHDAHARGHALLLIEATGTLVAGDMVSDVEIPLPDLDAADPIGDYERALDTIETLAERTTWFVPGHGTIGDAAELRRRIDLDRRYLTALRAGGRPDDTRFQDPWLFDERERQMAWVAAH